MKIFIVYAYTSDGERHLQWVRKLPADFDWDEWANSRWDAMRVLGISKFEVEEASL
jgi:hypothetical protein